MSSNSVITFRFFLSIYFIVIFYSVNAGYRQEKARLVHINPKYLKDCSIFTGRQSRNGTYHTNVTVTTLMPFSNNVSAAVILQMASGSDFRVSYKFCDMLKEGWVANFLKLHSDITVVCPLMPGTYKLFNMELPPKNMPIPMVASDYSIILEVFMTTTGEQMLKAVTTLRYENTKWHNK